MNRTTRTLALTAILTLAPVTLTGEALYAGNFNPTVTLDTTQVTLTGPTDLPACTTEDGGNLPCFWDGTKRGNHAGRTYWIDTNETTHYLIPKS